MTQNEVLVSTLPAVAKLALVYAPASSREQTLALLALDTRLASLIRRSKEPMLAQLRISWWREAISGDPATWPSGEPILASLRTWGNAPASVSGLMDAWEALTAPSPLAEESLAAFARGRGNATAALADVIGRPQDREAARVLGEIWALEDLAMRLGREDEREIACRLASELPNKLPRVGKHLRTLRVLAGLSRRRREKGSEEGASSPAALLTALKLGLLPI